MSDQEKFATPGNTPLVKIGDIYFKCEYKNPTGSHKDRATVLQISKLKKRNINKAVISSSGNAAISAATYCKEANIDLTVFVSPDVNKKKLQILQSLKCEIIQSKKPVSAAFKFSREFNAYNLRQSTDPVAFSGYERIATEILKKVVPDAIFLPVSSGTTLIGIALGFQKARQAIPIYAVQTDVIHPIAGVFDKDFKEASGKSLSDAIVARFTPLEDKVIKIIKESNGFGWVINNKEMLEARRWLVSHRLDCSYEGAASLASLWKAKRKGYKFDNPVCLLTGKYY